MNRNDENNQFAPKDSNDLRREYIATNFSTAAGKALPPPPPYPSAPPSRIPPHPTQEVCSLPQATSPSITSEIFVNADPLCNVGQSTDKATVCPRIMVQPETPCPTLANESFPSGISTLNSHIPVSWCMK